MNLQLSFPSNPVYTYPRDPGATNVTAKFWFGKVHICYNPENNITYIFFLRGHFIAKEGNFLLLLSSPTKKIPTCNSKWKVMIHGWFEN
jgi:hypothetical protein